MSKYVYIFETHFGLLCVDLIWIVFEKPSLSFVLHFVYHHHTKPSSPLFKNNSNLWETKVRPDLWNILKQEFLSALFVLVDEYKNQFFPHFIQVHRIRMYILDSFMKWSQYWHRMNMKMLLNDCPKVSVKYLIDKS